MQLSQISSQNFNGVNMFGEKNFNRASRKLFYAFNDLTDDWVNPVLKKLEAERGADVCFHVKPNGIVDLSLTRKYIEFPDGQSAADAIERDIVLVNSKGKNAIAKTIDTNAPAKVWKQQLRNFIRSCERYLAKDDAPKNQLENLANTGSTFIPMKP